MFSFPLGSSLVQMKLVADAINLAMKNAERRRKMVEIQNLFDDLQVRKRKHKKKKEPQLFKRKRTTKEQKGEIQERQKKKNKEGKEKRNMSMEMNGRKLEIE